MLNPAIEESFNNKDKAAQMRREIGDINSKFKTIFFSLAQLLEFEKQANWKVVTNNKNKEDQKIFKKTHNHIKELEFFEQNIPFNTLIYILNSLTPLEMLQSMKDFLYDYDDRELFTYDEEQFAQMVEGWFERYGEDFMNKFFSVIDRRTYFRYSQLDKLFSNQIRSDTHYGPFLTHAFFDLFKNDLQTRMSHDKAGFTTDFWKMYPYIVVLIFQGFFNKIKGRKECFYVTLGVSEDNKRIPVNEGSVYSILSSFETITTNYKVSIEKLEKTLILYRTMHSDELSEFQLQLIIKDMKNRYLKNQDEIKQPSIPFREALEWITLKLCVHVHISKIAYQIEDSLFKGKYMEKEVKKKRNQIKIILESLMWHGAALKEFNSHYLQTKFEEKVNILEDQEEKSDTIKPKDFRKIIKKFLFEVLPHISKDSILKILGIFHSVNRINVKIKSYERKHLEMFRDQVYTILVIAGIDRIRDFIILTRKLVTGKSMLLQSQRDQLENEFEKKNLSMRRVQVKSVKDKKNKKEFLKLHLILKELIERFSLIVSRKDKEAIAENEKLQQKAKFVEPVIKGIETKGKGQKKRSSTLQVNSLKPLVENAGRRTSNFGVILKNQIEQGLAMEGVEAHQEKGSQVLEVKEGKKVEDKPGEKKAELKEEGSDIFGSIKADEDVKIRLNLT